MNWVRKNSLLPHQEAPPPVSGGALRRLSKPGRSPRLLVALTALLGALSSLPLYAVTLPVTEGYLGEVLRYRVGRNESLIEAARKFDLGYNAIVAANPGVDPLVPGAGTLVTIPTAWILPVIPRRPCIVINLPEFRLYYLPKGASGPVVTFPLGIGDQGKDTPVGSFLVIEKISHPSWYVPASILAERKGLPKVVPPGPDNPMGSHALRLSLKTVLIHGTDRPWGIGRRSSHGCLRLYPEDIVRLFQLVPKGMRVLIVKVPIKVAARGERVFVEAHQYGREEVSAGRAIHLLAARNLLVRTDFSKLIRAMEERKGYPVDVTLQLPIRRPAGPTGRARPAGR